MQIILTRDAEKAILADTVTTGGVLHTATLHLFTNNLNPGDTTVADDLTEPVFTGYAAATPTLVGPINVSDGAALVLSNTFVCTTAPSAPVTCFGWYVMSGETTPRLVYAARFDDAVTVSEAGDAVEIDVHLTLKG